MKSFVNGNKLIKCHERLSWVKSEVGLALFAAGEGSAWEEERHQRGEESDPSSHLI